MIVAVIPVFNEEKVIAQLVKQSQKYCDEVVVVDDGSQDNTLEIIKGLGIKYIHHARNQGQGAATRTGINVALSLGADIIVTLDGDGQHDPSHIPLLLESLNDVDVAVGSRFLQSTKVPEYRKFGIGLITWLHNVGHKQKLSDSLLCLRAFKSDVLRNINIEENRFGFCPEMLIKIRHKGYRIKDIPVTCTYHKDYAQNSTYAPIKLGLILVWKTIYWRIKIEH